MKTGGMIIIIPLDMTAYSFIEFIDVLDENNHVTSKAHAASRIRSRRVSKFDIKNLNFLKKINLVF
jgi:hypothetical protein